MQVSLPYDLRRRQTTLNIPSENLLGILEPEKPRGVEVERALEDAFSCSEVKLDELLRTREEVAVLIDDHTRPTPTAATVKVLLNLCEEYGVKDVTVIFAKGSHNTPPEKYLERKIDRTNLRRCNLVMHDCYEPGQHVFRGVTRFGTPVWVNKAAAKADIRVGIGSVFPMGFSGFTGGGKIVLPGISSIETINQNHGLFLSPTAEMGRVEGNVVRQDMEEAAQLAHLDLLIDYVLNPDGEPVRAFAGTSIRVFNDAVDLSTKIYRVSITKETDIVVTAPGAVEDIDLGHAMKALKPADIACRDGGTLILSAACPMGVNWEELLELCQDVRRAGWDREQIMRLIVNREVEAIAGAVIHRYYHLFFEGRKELVLVSEGVGDEEAEMLGFRRMESVQEALNYALEIQGKGARVFVAPHGGLIWPVTT